MNLNQAQSAKSVGQTERGGKGVGNETHSESFLRVRLLPEDTPNETTTECTGCRGTEPGFVTTFLATETILAPLSQLLITPGS